MMTNRDPEGWIFQSNPHTINVSFFLLTIKCRILCLKKKCADSEGGDRGSGPPWKITKLKGFFSNTGLDPLKNHKATIQCWAIIGLPAKRHLNDL